MCCMTDTFPGKPSNISFSFYADRLVCSLLSYLPPLDPHSQQGFIIIQTGSLFSPKCYYHVLVLDDLMKIAKVSAEFCSHRAWSQVGVIVSAAPHLCGNALTMQHNFVKAIFLLSWIKWIVSKTHTGYIPTVHQNHISHPITVVALWCGSTSLQWHQTQLKCLNSQQALHIKAALFGSLCLSPYFTAALHQRWGKRTAFHNVVDK